MTKQSNQRERDLTELGAKSRAGNLMSSLFRAVASEMTELLSTKVPGRTDGKMKTILVSKAEAIVRDIIQKALPVGEDETDNIDPKVRMEYRKLIMDRVDGRAGTVGEDAKRQGESIPGKVSRINKDFLNDTAKKTKAKKGGPPEL
jgi:hypothetical protein